MESEQNVLSNLVGCPPCEFGGSTALGIQPRRDHQTLTGLGSPSSGLRIIPKNFEIFSAQIVNFRHTFFMPKADIEILRHRKI